MEDRNQELESDHEDIREMEGLLEIVRDYIAEVVEKIAVYLRERFERDRGRGRRPDLDWSR